MHNVSGLPQVFQKYCSACFAITQTYILKESCLNLVLKLLQSPDSEHQLQCFPRQMLFQAAPGSNWFGFHLFHANTPFSPSDIVAILPQVKDIHFTLFISLLPAVSKCVFQEKPWRTKKYFFLLYCTSTSILKYSPNLSFSNSTGEELYIIHSAVESRLPL